MNIQISVVIWTVICFIVLMLILRNLLFVPVLKIMDERRSRIEKAKAKKSEQKKALKEHEKELLLKKEEYIKAQKEQAQKTIEEIQSEGKKQLEDAKNKRLSDTAYYRDNISKEHEQIVIAASKEMENIAQILAKNITAHKV